MAGDMATKDVRTVETKESETGLIRFRCNVNMHDSFSTSSQSEGIDILSIKVAKRKRDCSGGKDI